MDRLLQDLRIAVRSLLRRPTFASVAILTLAVGIGATTAIFSLVDAVLLRPLPFREPSRLFRVWQAFPDRRNNQNAGSTWDRSGISYPQYVAIAGAKDVVESAAVFRLRTATITGAGDTERVNLATTSATLLSTLGLRAVVGRDFSAEDEAGQGSGVAMIAYELWRRRFAADASVVGRSVTLDGQPYVVVGVIPPEMRLLATTRLGGSRRSCSACGRPIR